MVNPAGEGDGTGGSRTPGGAGNGVDVRAGAGQSLGAEAECRKRKATAGSVGSNKKILEILENQIDAKRRQLQQLEGLYSTMEFPLTQLKDGKKIPDVSCDKDEGAEESEVDGEADDKKLKCLELEAAKLDAEIQIKMENLGEMLEHEKFQGELRSAAAQNCTQMSMELLDIRKELIMGLNKLQGCNLMPKHGNIGVKSMGEINVESLGEACHQKYEKDEALYKAYNVVSVWGDELKNPSWHPFKVIEADGTFQEVVDDDDEKIKALRIEHGDVVCNIVKTALMEMNEYNPSGRYPVPELWNFSEGRKVTTQEVLGYLFRQLRRRRQQA